MEYPLILTISLLKWMDALVLLSAIYSIHGTAWQKFDTPNYFFSFDKVSQKSDVNLAVIILF